MGVHTVLHLYLNVVQPGKSTYEHRHSWLQYEGAWLDGLLWKGQVQLFGGEEVDKLEWVENLL